MGVRWSVVVVAMVAVLPACTRLNPLFGVREDDNGEEAFPEDSTSAASTEPDATTGGGGSSSGGGGSSGGSEGSSRGDSDTSADTSTAGESSSGDPTQGAGGPELCGYSAATAVFVSDAEPVANLSTASADERDPFVVEGGEMIYFWRADDAGAGIPRGMYVAQADGEGFAEPTPVPGFAPTDEVLKLALSADGLVAVIAAGFDDGTFNLWQLERDNPATSFDASSAAQLFELELPPPVFDPHLSGDALGLYFAPQFGAGDQALYVSHRDDAASPFGAPQHLTELDFEPTREADPTVTADERVIVFTVDDYVVGPTLWTASRDTDDGGFVDARDLGDLGRVGELRDPHLSADGCHLWYINADAGTFDIWHAVAAPGE